MGDPTQAAHVLGKLLAQFGEDNVVWGTDSIWYGSPQDQIEAFRAFQITEEFQERFGYPALTPAIKAKILGATSARLYGVEPLTGQLPARAGTARPGPPDLRRRQPHLRADHRRGRPGRDGPQRDRHHLSTIARRAGSRP